jgi:hypothetical protein
LVGAAVAASVLVIPAIGQSPVTGDVGVLSLHLGSDGAGDRFVFDPSDSSANLVQTLSQSNCKLSSRGDVLVSVIGDGTQTNKRPFEGLKDHRIGVGQNGEGNGEPCARINKDLGQFLTLSLTGELAGAAINYAEIDLGFKFNGDALLTLSMGGAFVDQVQVFCSGLSDCGPDSGADDNERVILYLEGDEAPSCEHCQSFPIKGVFDTIVIEPGSVSPTGSVSLEGGFNGSPAGPSGTTDTIFNIVQVFDGELDCGATFPAETDGVVSAEITRLENTTGSAEDCTPKPFNLEVIAAEDTVEFFPVDSPGATPQDAAYRAELIFSPNTAVEGELPDIALEYDQLDNGIAFFEPVPWCTGDPFVAPDQPGSINTGVISDDHTWCIVSANTQVFDGDETQTTWLLVGTGDPVTRVKEGLLRSDDPQLMEEEVGLFHQFGMGTTGTRFFDGGLQHQ